MLSKKFLLSIFIFSFFMILTSIIKNKTRIIEKNIFDHQKKIAFLKNELYESQLDYYYLSSPESLSKKILEYSNRDYASIKFSRIYFSLNQFLDEQKKISLSDNK